MDIQAKLYVTQNIWRWFTLTLNKSAYIRMCILELSKVWTYEFCYGYIKNRYGNNSRILFKTIIYRTCNCQVGEVVSEGALWSNQPNYKEKMYFGIVKESFKGCLYNHNLPSRNEFYENDTELSK